ncbi:MAG: hypothetical protein AAFY72_19115, partial [Cyanobacteria bacterium J06649_4]
MVRTVKNSEVYSPHHRDSAAVDDGDRGDTFQENGRQAEQLRQNTLLAGVAEAARRLLAIEDFEAAVNGALEAVATSANIDRIYILEN